MDHGAFVTAKQRVRESLVDQAKKITTALGKEGRHVLDLTGKTTFKESAGLIQQARLILTNDSVMMHVAAASGNPMISFW